MHALSHRFRRPILCLSLMLPLWAAFTRHACAQIPGVEHLVVIGVDGMSVDGVKKADDPNMKALIAGGAWTLRARGVMPTKSSPNWASMIMGAGPELHGITSNEWERDKFQIEAFAKGKEGIFPTIYGAMADQRPELHQAVFHDWDGYGRLIETYGVKHVEDCKGSPETADKAIAYFKENKPNFLFLHFDDVDHTGHEIGWATPEYYAAVAMVDGLIGKIQQAVRDAGVYDKTIFLVTSDHGGHDKSHGWPIMSDLEIPWILSGPGVRKGHELSGFVSTCDTAATIAHIFGIKQPACWTARPVLEAFEAMP